MKKIRFPILILLIAALMGAVAPSAFALEPPTIEGTYAVLLETNTDTVLYEKAAYERAYPASLTKMMTVLLAVEAIENQAVLPSGVTAALTNEVTASANLNYDQIVDGSTAGILEGETMSLEDLLYCAMLSSANEACNILAEHIGGSVPAFIDMMNERAAALGCSGTHFANTHGLPNADHYTTAWDLTLIAREAIAHPLFKEICSTRTRTLNPTNMSAGRALYNTNSLINTNDHYPGDYLYEGAAGIKTGFTADAGYCLASVATREGVNNIQLISIVLHAPAYDDNGDGIIDRYCNFTDSTALFDWGFDNWGYREILKSTDIITEVPVSMGDGTDTVAVRPSTSIVRLLPNDDDLSGYQKVPTIYATADGQKLEAPISAGQVLGEIAIMKDGKTVGTSSLVASSDVNLSRVRYMRTEIGNTLRLPIVQWTFWILLLLFLFYIFVVVRYRQRRRQEKLRARQARIAQEIANSDEDVREWYNSPGSSEPSRIQKPQRRKPSARLARPDPQTPSTPDDDSFRDYFEEFFGGQDEDK